MSSDIEDTIKVIGTAPGAPQSKRLEISSHLKERIVATKVKALTAKVGERPGTTTATSNQLAHEKANTSASAQINMLTSLVKSLLKAMEGHTSAVEALKREHANHIEALTKTFAGQIEALKAEVAELIQS
ncbi:hypothetical protein B0J14DRAFT_191937 [Halenospora varia]|nr:hypothetical protein B0J14DRAFT_191937 [Halenospora varia]